MVDCSYDNIKNHNHPADYPNLIPVSPTYQLINVSTILAPGISLILITQKQLPELTQ